MTVAHRLTRMVAAGAVLTVLAISGEAFAEKSKNEKANYLYRYRNHEGVLVMEDRVPPEFAGSGYEVLSPSGRVIETVLPAAPAASAAEPGAAVDTAGSEREDKFLLASYSTVADIDAAKKRKLAQFSREIEIAKTNLNRTRQRRTDLQAQADKAQAGGRKAPAAVIESLRGLDAEEKTGETMVVRREQEYRDTERLYDGYAARFKVLKASPPSPPAAASPAAGDGDAAETPPQ